MNSAVVLGAGTVGGALLSLLRNIVVARLLAPDDFGIAVTFAVTVALIETLSDLGVNRLVVQAPEGDDHRFVSALHSVQLLRGCLGALLLLLLAAPYAAVVGASSAVWAYQVLALVPLLRGVWHLDVFRLQRRMSFALFASATILSQLASFIAILPLSYVWTDYQLMLWVLLLQQVLFCVITHVGAERPFGVRWDTVAAQRAIAFGLPLLGNAMLVFVIFHGDRLVIANVLGLEALAWFSVAAMLTLTPAMLAASFIQQFFLPLVSAGGEGSEQAAIQTVQAALFAGCCMVVGFAVFGPELLALLFGDAYIEAQAFIVWLAIAQAVRIAKAGPFVVAIGHAETSNPLFSNIARAAMLPVIYLVLQLGGGIGVVIALSAIGEALAFAISVFLLRERFRAHWRRLRDGVAASLALLAAVALFTVLTSVKLTGFVADASMAAGLIVGAGLVLATMPELRQFFLMFGRKAIIPKPGTTR